MISCPKCGYENKDDAVYCGLCYEVLKKRDHHEGEETHQQQKPDVPVDVKYPRQPGRNGIGPLKYVIIAALVLGSYYLGLKTAPDTQPPEINTPGLFEKGIDCVDQNKFDEARTIFEEIIEMHPDHFLSRKMLNIISSMENQQDELFKISNLVGEEREKAIQSSRKRISESSYGTQGIKDNPNLSLRNVQATWGLGRNAGRLTVQGRVWNDGLNPIDRVYLQVQVFDNGWRPVSTSRASLSAPTAGTSGIASNQSSPFVTTFVDRSFSIKHCKVLIYADNECVGEESIYVPEP